MGEIGLDYKDKNINKQKQKQIFELQLDLAIELNRSVVIHCVRAHGDLLKILEKRFIKKRINKISLDEYQTASSYVQQVRQTNKESDLSKKELKKFKKMLKKISVYEKEQEQGENPKEVGYVTHV